ncbi:radical SAM protein [Paenibacillus sp. HN-1]|uniref:SPL family radical SAM protein n=1 Tax=Paenibacillus TaxID=44249 RepID=UPI001CA9AFE7|nr:MULTISPECIES: radical SAM protein [Paenibacillus]MBY9079407.1 radical SAM protein [Paenibacillus sp. CGMCC 1.18879]MBY9085702.1 radical SAM protein [Paenibacillus sinensis]
MVKIYEPVTTKTGMTRVKEERMPFGWSINSYRGCAHACSYCFARGFQGFLDRKGDDEFQNHILLKTNAAEALEEQLARLAKRFKHDLAAMREEVGEVMLGTVTDPYQPVESKALLTRQCLKVLARYQIRTSVTTRSPLILRDLELLKEMPSLSVNISLNILNDGIARRLEPGSPLPSRRVELLHRLAEHGIMTNVFIAPILPLLSDSEEELERLFLTAVESGAGSIMTSLLRLSPEVKNWYFRTLKEEFPDLLTPYRKLYAGGGYAEDGYRGEMSRLLDSLHRRFGPDLRKNRERHACRSLPMENLTGLEQEMHQDTQVNRRLPEPAEEPPLEQLSFSF